MSSRFQGLQNQFLSDGVYKLPSIHELRLAGYSIIATNPCTLSSITAAGTNTYDQTAKSLHKATADATNIVLVFGNYGSIQPSQINANHNPMLIGASLQKFGSSFTDDTGVLTPLVFKNGKNKTQIDPAALVYSEPAAFTVKQNDNFFIRTYRSVYMPPAPAAPTLTPSATGGTLVAGASYWVCIVYVFQDGFYTMTSTGVQATITAGGGNTGSITVTAPASIPSAIGYQCFMTSRTDGQTGLYAKATELTPFGTNAVITAEISSNPLLWKRSGSALNFPNGSGLAGGTNFDGLATGEGWRAGDQTFNGSSTITQQTSSNPYYPVAILGKTKTPQKTVALEGDSIMAGTGDHGYIYASGGFATRAIANQLSITYDKAINPLYGYVRVPLGGEGIIAYANQQNTNQYFKGRLSIAELATNVICNYGTNDLASGTAAIQAAILVNAEYHISRGQKYFHCTIIPKVTSTDGFQTVANQTVQGTEATRLALNAWLRDTSSSGFVQQCSNPSLVGVIDVCKYLEVNSSNVLTQNGGFWRIPTGFTPITGTFTTGGTNQFVDTSKNFTANAYKGYSLLVTSGAAINKTMCIGWNNTNTINTYSSIGATAAIGDSYSIVNLSTIDGIHPTTQGHLWMTQAVQEVFNQLI